MVFPSRQTLNKAEIMNIASQIAEQDFLDFYREMVLDYLNSAPASEERQNVKEIIDNLYDHWDTTQGNAKALNQVWIDKVFCWI